MIYKAAFRILRPSLEEKKILRKNKELSLRYNLAFFDEAEKTEKATTKKKEKARERGQIAKSQEVETSFLFLGCFFALKYFGSWMYGKIVRMFNYGFQLIGETDDIFTESFMSSIIPFMFTQTIIIALPILIVATFMSITANLIQVGWHPNFYLLRINFGALDPVQGMKRLFSFKVMINFIKSIFKFSAILFVMYLLIKDKISWIPNLGYMGLYEASIYIFDLVIQLGLSIGVLFLFLAIFDYAYEKLKLDRDIKMTKHEVKEEFKQSEGDPKIKNKIRQKMKEISMKRMMQDVPYADVIITNPTHYAVALKYDKEKYGDTPIVTAKGVDFLAQRIRDLAKENNVEIVENVQLARALYKSVDVGKQIPTELYQAVAEVLAFVYRLKNIDKTGKI